MSGSSTNSNHHYWGYTKLQGTSQQMLILLVFWGFFLFLCRCSHFPASITTSHKALASVRLSTCYSPHSSLCFFSPSPLATWSTKENHGNHLRQRNNSCWNAKIQMCMQVCKAKMLKWAHEQEHTCKATALSVEHTRMHEWKMTIITIISLFI